MCEMENIHCILTNSICTMKNPREGWTRQLLWYRGYCKLAEDMRYFDLVLLPQQNQKHVAIKTTDKIGSSLTGDKQHEFGFNLIQNTK